MAAVNETDPARLVRAKRLIFEYEGDRIRLVTEQPVQVAAANLSSAALGELGVFVDVRDAANRTLARIPARHALADSIEVFPERHDEPIVRRDVTAPKGAFTVLVPAPDDTDHATIVRVSTSHRASAVATPDAVDLVSFPLTSNR